MNNEELILKALAKQSPQHIRKLARKTGLNPNTISNIVSKLEAENLVEKDKDEETNRVLISISRSNKARMRHTFYNIELLYDSGLITALEDHFSLPTIFLFGSMAKAENHSDSDIDLFIISDEKKAFDTVPFEKKLGHPIQLFVHTPSEFEKLCESSPQLINNVLNGMRLTGYVEVFR